MTKDLLEDVRQIIGCEFISDLRNEPFNSRARKLMVILDLKLYPFSEVTDAVSYLLFGEQSFESVRQVKDVLGQESRQHGIQRKEIGKIAASAKI